MTKITTLALACGALTSLPLTGLAQDGYEGGRGLITLEGPTGMFINPTSGTLPAGAATAQYCFFLPNNDSDVVGHGGILAAGLTDRLEIGVQGTYVDIDGADELKGGGPFARLRLIDAGGGVPEVSVGGYARFSDDEPLEKIGAFLAGSHLIPIADEGLLRGIRLHAGVRNIWVEETVSPDDTSLVGYGGLELELPARLSVVGEISTKDEDFAEVNPYSVGVQWKAAGVNVSVAGIEDGNDNDLNFYFGIGIATKL